MKTLAVAAASSVLVGLLAGCATAERGGEVQATEPASVPQERGDGEGDDVQLVDVPMPIWMTTYAVLDNVQNVEQVGGDEELAAHAAELMERGSQAAATHPQARQGWGGWPPSGTNLRVPLSARDIQMIRQAFRDGIETTRLLLSDYPLSEQEREEQTASLKLEEEGIAFWG